MEMPRVVTVLDGTIVLNVLVFRNGTVPTAEIILLGVIRVAMVLEGTVVFKAEVIRVATQATL